MSAPALPPTPSTTLVILLGASAWPNSPGFSASEAFVHAAQGFREYLLDPHGFGLPEANLLDQFDAPSSAFDQLDRLGSFLDHRTRALSAANQAVRDVLVFFVGHGGFAGPSHDFYLLPRRANANILRASGMSIDALADVLREKARQTRRYLFLDCCFAAAAFRSFQGGPDQTAIEKTLDAFHDQARSSGFPRKGTVLLCSSDQKSPSLLLPDESCTMFSYALLETLRNGDLHRPLQLSFRDLKELAQDHLAALPEKNAPRPGLYSPDQSEGDVADVPFFRNWRAKEEQRRQAEEAERTRREEEERRRQVEEEKRRLAEEAEQVRKEGEQLRKVEEARLRKIGEEEVQKEKETGQTRLAEEERVNTSESQLSLHAAAPPQNPASSSVTIVSPPRLPDFRQLRRPRSPVVVTALALLSLILLSAGSLGMYRVATGNWLWARNAPSGPSAQTPTNGSTWTWTLQQSGTTQEFDGIAWSGKQFVAVGRGDTILTSPDGSHWAPHGSGSSSFLDAVIWAGSQFVAVGWDGTILTSPDGHTWSPQNSLTSDNLGGVAWSGKQFVAVGGSNAATGTIFTSSNAHTWRSVPPPGGSAFLEGVAWLGSLFVAVGDSGTILTSPDGLHWTHQHWNGSNQLLAVAWSEKQFVAVGDSGTILASSDGSHWAIQHFGRSLPFGGIAWSGSQFVAVGNGIVTSPDGSHWTRQDSGQWAYLTAVVWSNMQFVAVGLNGTILDGRR